MLNPIIYKPNGVLIIPDDENITDFKFYFYSVREFSSKTIECASLFRMKLSLEEFCLFIKAWKHVQSLGFIYCNIITDFECEFGELRECKIQRLGFDESGGREFSNWIDYRERLFNILKGIDGWQNLKSSLKKVSLKFNWEEVVITELKSDIERLFPLLNSTNNNVLIRLVLW